MVLNEKKICRNLMKNLSKIYDEESHKEYILEIDVEYRKILNIPLNDLHSDIPFLPEGMKIKNYNKLVCNLYDKKNYVVQIRALKQALNHRLLF